MIPLSSSVQICRTSRNTPRRVLRIVLSQDVGKHRRWHNTWPFESIAFTTCALPSHNVDTLPCLGGSTNGETVDHSLLHMVHESFPSPFVRLQLIDHSREGRIVLLPQDVIDLLDDEAIWLIGFSMTDLQQWGAHDRHPIPPFFPHADHGWHGGPDACRSTAGSFRIQTSDFLQSSNTVSFLWFHSKVARVARSFSETNWWT